LLRAFLASAGTSWRALISEGEENGGKAATAIP